MMIELSIHEDYVPTWGAWEGLREVFQNALDEHDRGRPIKVKHKDDQLIVGNEGAELRAEHLLIGMSDKAGTGLRGRHGEGLDVGLLALVRAGFSVEIHTPTENWTPLIKRSEKYDADVLYIKTTKVKQRRGGTEFRISPVTEELYAQVKLRFLDLQALGPDDAVENSYYGAVLLNPAHMGMIFVKGIYVQNDSEIVYGYNFLNVELDRDRRIVSDFNLKWASSAILASAMAARPELLEDRIYRMVCDGRKEVENIHCFGGDAPKKAIARQFAAEHGDAVPVASIGDSQEMSSFGRKSVVVNQELRKILENEMDTPQKVRDAARKMTTWTYAWDELSEKERFVLERAAQTIDTAIAMFAQNIELCKAMGAMDLHRVDVKVLDIAQVVDFRENTYLGLYKDGKILISKAVLGNYFAAIRIVIHEMAHVVSNGADGSLGHASALQAIWVAVYFLKHREGVE